MNLIKILKIEQFANFVNYIWYIMQSFKLTKHVVFFYCWYSKYPIICPNCRYFWEIISVDIGRNQFYYWRPKTGFQVTSLQQRIL